MKDDHLLAPSDRVRPVVNAFPGARVLRGLGRVLQRWARRRADEYAAAAAYEALSGLSDADLRRRGLSRANLARDVVETCGERDGSS